MVLVYTAKEAKHLLCTDINIAPENNHKVIYDNSFSFIENKK
jgi:hypothetical protein